MIIKSIILCHVSKQKLRTMCTAETFTQMGLLRRMGRAKGVAGLGEGGEARSQAGAGTGQGRERPTGFIKSQVRKGRYECR